MWLYMRICNYQYWIVILDRNWQWHTEKIIHRVQIWDSSVVRKKYLNFALFKKTDIPFSSNFHESGGTIEVKVRSAPRLLVGYNSTKIKYLTSKSCAQRQFESGFCKIQVSAHQGLDFVLMLSCFDTGSGLEIHFCYNRCRISCLG